MDIKAIIDGATHHQQFAAKHGVSGMSSAHHVVGLGHLMSMVSKHLCSCEIDERVCSNCNFDVKTRSPICGNCMYHAFDPETGLTFCTASKRPR